MCTFFVIEKFFEKLLHFHLIYREISLLNYLISLPSYPAFKIIYYKLYMCFYFLFHPDDWLSIRKRMIFLYFRKEFLTNRGKVVLLQSMWVVLWIMLWRGGCSATCSCDLRPTSSSKLIIKKIPKPRVQTNIKKYLFRRYILFLVTHDIKK